MLFSSLHTLGFGACGKVQVDRQRMPKCMTAAKLKKVEMKSTEVEKGMLALKRQVNMPSTIHNDSMMSK